MVSTHDTESTIRAARLAGSYAFVAALWILVSDSALAALGLPEAALARFGALKGLGFVMVTTVALFLVTRRFASDSAAQDREYRELFAHNPNPMWVYEIDTLRFLAVNDAAIVKYGYRRDEFLSMTIRDIRPSEDVVRLEENVSAVREGVDEAGVWRHVTKQGSLLWVEITSHVTEFEGRRAEFVLVRDVTEAHEAREDLARYQERLEDLVAERTQQLEAANEQLAAATEAKSAFLATMSHELRTPLNTVIGFSGVLRDGLAGPLTSEQAHQIGLIKDAGQHLLELIDDVLDLSKIEAGRVDIRSETVSVLALAHGLESVFGPLAEAKGLEFDCETVFEGMMWVDRRKLEQVLRNLLSNAVKYTAAGSVRLRVTAQGDDVRFAVHDTGPGIAPDRQASVFREFVRVQPGDAPPSEGTGLGLAIAARLAQLLGGRIELESVPGAGSVFTLVVPRAGGGSADSRAVRKGE
jgi:PAS domain S-box-containing protein